VKSGNSFVLALLIGSLLLLAACSSPDKTSSIQKAPANAAGASADPASAFDHSGLESILTKYVNESGWVDYAGLEKDRAALDQYLGTLESAQPQQFPNDNARLAFWINAYNAFTLADVLESVYRKYKGVKEIENQFFAVKKHRIAGEQLTLNQIEERGRKIDPRVHFAVVCASTSCPKLQRFAYNAAQLDEQLNKVAREFLADPARGLQVKNKENKVLLSPIFKWYAGDFTASSAVLARVKAEVSGSDILDYVKKSAPAEAVSFIEQSKPAVGYLEYDWSLNSQETHK
jgi:hypothetical protein